MALAFLLHKFIFMAPFCRVRATRSVRLGVDCPSAKVKNKAGDVEIVITEMSDDSGIESKVFSDYNQGEVIGKKTDIEIKADIIKHEKATQNKLIESHL